MARIRVTGTSMAIEEIAWKHRQAAFPDDAVRAADLSGYVERIFALNPGLAAVSQDVPVGTEIEMPDIEREPAVRADRLWD